MAVTCAKTSGLPTTLRAATHAFERGARLTIDSMRARGRACAGVHSRDARRYRHSRARLNAAERDRGRGPSPAAGGRFSGRIAAFDGDVGRAWARVRGFRS